MWVGTWDSQLRLSQLLLLFLLRDGFSERFPVRMEEFLSALRGPFVRCAVGFPQAAPEEIRNVDTGIQRALDCDVLKPIHRSRR